MAQVYQPRAASESVLARLDAINVPRYYLRVRQFHNEEARRLYDGQAARRLPPDIQRRARMRLQRVVAAVVLTDLRVPPSHRLEALRGDREGQHSIRINDQWRVCFIWTERGAMEIKIVDYH